MNKKTWYAVDVMIVPEAVEAIEYGLSEAGADGTEYSTLGKKEIEEIVRVIGYFQEKPDESHIQSELENALTIYNLAPDSMKEFIVREVENQDWLAEWKKSWQPTITNQFIIAPMWQTVESKEKLVIRIEPSMAFGTGTHETTRLCLKAIEENYNGESLLDVGTGTGILAIAAAKLNTQAGRDSSDIKILACDTDEDSIKIAEENAQVNDAESIDFYVGSIGDNTPQFDFVCANLTADVIIPILPLLVEKSNKKIVLSGILGEQEAWVDSELKKNGVEIYDVQRDDEWISILIEK